MDSFSFRRSERGFGLIEIMVSLVVGMILTAGLVRMLSSSKRIYRVEADISQMLDSGRFASHYLEREVREAGNVGCGGLQTVHVTNNLVGAPAAYSVTPTTAVTGLDNVAAGNPYGATAGSDILLLRKGSSVYRRLSSAMGNGAAAIQVGAAVEGVAAGDVAVIADCTEVDVFQVSGTAVGGGAVSLFHGAGFNQSANLSKAYGTDATVMAYRSSAYFVAPAPAGMPALWRQEGGDVPLEMVDGVEDMQLRYGEDTDGDGVANRYATAAAVTDWSGVVTVRLELLLVSDDDNIARAAQAYTLDGVAVMPTDRRLRRVFTTTVAVRGRTL